MDLSSFDNFTMAAETVSNITTRQGATQGSRLLIAQPAHEYHADRDALSCSMLKPLLTSPAHFRTALLDVTRGSDALDFGTLVHSLLLEPGRTGHEVAVYPGVGHGRDKAYVQFVEANAGKLVVDEPMFARARRLAEKVRDRTYMGRKLGAFIDEALTEASIYVTEPTTGLDLRTRMDIYHPEISFDLKSTRHGTVHAFIKDAIALHYDLQAFMYSLARALYEGTATAKPFIFIAAESDDPLSVNVVKAGESFMNNGARKFQECISIFKACTETDYWPDLSSDAVAEIDHWQQFTPQRAWA